tara:strand:- start:1010 stop:1147 length:138 start_codon:yes stop_codon:yes gene_type:complete
MEAWWPNGRVALKAVKATPDCAAESFMATKASQAFRLKNKPERLD